MYIPHGRVETVVITCIAKGSTVRWEHIEEFSEKLKQGYSTVHDQHISDISNVILFTQQRQLNLCLSISANSSTNFFSDNQVFPKGQWHIVQNSVDNGPPLYPSPLKYYIYGKIQTCDMHLTHTSHGAFTTRPKV